MLVTNVMPAHWVQPPTPLTAPVPQPPYCPGCGRCRCCGQPAPQPFVAPPYIVTVTHTTGLVAPAQAGAV